MILIIYAHPDTDGFNPRILKEVKRVLELNGESYEVLDLYEMDYDPVLKAGELYTAGNKEVSKENKGIQKKIQNASELIFIYPIWWGGMPAILKGFMDRVFTPGFAFQYKRDKLINFIPEGYLKDKKAVCFVTSGGPRVLYFLLLHPVKIINRFFIFGFMGARSKTFQMYKATNLDKLKKEEVERSVCKGLRWIMK
ncbi:MAG: NAD(P)H-dependent oxidoreductase [Patescibacteria group bacterium]